MNTLLPPMQKQLVNILAFLVILLRVSVIDQYYFFVSKILNQYNSFSVGRFFTEKQLDCFPKTLTIRHFFDVQFNEKRVF